MSQYALFQPSIDLLKSWQQSPPRWLQEVRRIDFRPVNFDTGPRDLAWLARSLPNLRELTYTDAWSKEVELGLLHGLPLQRLTLQGVALQSGLHGLPTTLKILSLRGGGAGLIGGRVDGLSNDVDSPGNLLVNLRSLTVRDWVMTNEQLTQLSRLPIIHLDFDCPIGKPMNAEALAGLPQSLVRLTLNEIDNLASLSGLEQLTHLELCDCCSLRSLDGLPRQLKSLNLNYLRIPFSEYPKIANCSGLESLALVIDERDPAGWKQALEQLPVSLRHLELQNRDPHLRHLGLDDPSILLPLARLTNLKTIVCDSYFAKAVRTLIETQMPSVQLEVIFD